MRSTLNEAEYADHAHVILMQHWQLKGLNDNLGCVIPPPPPPSPTINGYLVSERDTIRCNEWKSEIYM